jgi:molybdenum storage protein
MGDFAMIQEENGRLHIASPLKGESLMRKALLDATGVGEIYRPMPDLKVIKIGGQSIIDRGRKALIPILEEIIAARQKHEIIITTGGGTRSRHVYSIAIDLGMPAGVLAKLGASVSEQNALMVALLLSQHGGIKIGHDDVTKLPAYLALGCIPVMHAMPPYGLWEQPPEKGRIPPNRTDAGTFLLAEVLGAKRCILVKDEKGLYTDDPKRNPRAEFIAEIAVDDLLALDLEDLIVERSLLTYLARARSVREAFIVNGLQPGNLSRAIEGENAGTCIYKATDCDGGARDGAA